MPNIGQLHFQLPEISADIEGGTPPVLLSSLNVAN